MVACPVAKCNLWSPSPPTATSARFLQLAHAQLAARSALLDDVKETLRRRLGASSNELASLARMVASRIDLTLPSFLKNS